MPLVQRRSQPQQKTSLFHQKASDLQKWEEDFKKYKDALRIKREQRAKVGQGLYPQESMPQQTTGKIPSSREGVVQEQVPQKELGVEKKTIEPIQQQQQQQQQQPIQQQPIQQQQQQQQPIRQPIQTQPVLIQPVIQPVLQQPIIQEPVQEALPIRKPEKKNVVDEALLDMGEFPTEPEAYFPIVKQAMHLNIEDENELINRVGVKCGIHLQALTRDLNRLSALLESSMIIPNKREMAFDLADVLDDLDKIDLQIKTLLCNLVESNQGRDTILKTILDQEEQDQVREMEALKHRGGQRIVREVTIKPKEKLGTQQGMQPQEKVGGQQILQPREIKQEIQPQVQGIPSSKEEMLEQKIPEAPPLPESLKREQPLEKDKWKNTKYHPYFDVKDNPDALVLTSQMTGLQKDDIHLDVGKDSFTIQGFKAPTDEEEQLLTQKVKSNLPEGQSAQNIDDLILKEGAGKYGTFTETYKLPQGVDPNSVKASYEGGVLQINCPKRSIEAESAF